MYLPTGTPHSARSEQDTSLHVTIGINRYTWRDALTRAVTEALADSRYDEALPAGYLDDPRRLADPLRDELESMIKALQATDAHDLAEKRATTFLTDRPPLLRGGLLDQRVEITDDTRLERRPGSVCVLRPDGDRLRVLLGDRELRVPMRLEAALAFVRDTPSWRVADLPLDEKSRLVLARRLLREGLLQVHR